MMLIHVDRVRKRERGEEEREGRENTGSVLRLCCLSTGYVGEGRREKGKSGGGI